MYPADRKYTRDHEWVRVADGEGRVGITAYAQEQLGEVVYVELPAVGRTFAQGDQFGRSSRSRPSRTSTAPSAARCCASTTR